MAYTGPNKLPNVDHTSQQDAKPLMPPGGLLWRSRGIDAWLSRYQELPPQTFWEVNFESGVMCLKAALESAWQHALDVHGMDKGDCPVGGLFS